MSSKLSKICEHKTTTLSELVDLIQLSLSYVNIKLAMSAKKAYVAKSKINESTSTLDAFLSKCTW